MSEQNITPFLFEGERVVRVVERFRTPWFVAADVCRIIGTRDAAEAVEKLDADEKGTDSIRTLGGEQTVWTVSEGGLYTLILRSRDATKPGTVAHRFRKWVTAEVLPAIRKTGGYSIPAEPPSPGEEIPEGAKLRLVTEVRQSFGITAAQQMWFEMKLPIVPAMLADAAQPDMFRPGGGGGAH